MTKTSAIALTLAAFFAPLAAFAQPIAADLDSLYQSNHWFEFRDAMLREPSAAPFYRGEFALAFRDAMLREPSAAPFYRGEFALAFRDAMLREPSAAPFYRGEFALAFRDWPQAEKEFQAVMKRGADPMQAFEAGMGLLRIYEFSGRRKDGRALLAKMQQLMQSFREQRAIEPAAFHNFESYRTQLEAASDYPDQSVASRGRSRLLYTEIENRLMVPLRIDDHPANYFIDTGAESCVISLAEAKRLGLAVHPATIQIAGFDPDAKAAGIAVANDLVIGNFHLRNVLFLVEEGDDEIAGTIGLPVLFALETLRWSSDGTVEFGFPPQPRNPRDSNLCLAGPLLWTLAELSGKPLQLGVDTGSYESMLFPRFAREFADRMKMPVPLASRDAPDGTVAVALPNLRIGGLRALFAPALVFPKDPLEDAADLHGWLGMDLLGQAASVTLDLAAMKLTLDGIDSSGGTPTDSLGSCQLPPDFRCMPGFTCGVKAAGAEPCFVERIPIETPPGNAVRSEPGEGANCTLPAGARCEHGMLCRAVFQAEASCNVTQTPAAPAIAETAGTSPAAAPAPAPSAPKNAADARDLIQRSLKYESLDLEPPRDYIYIADDETKMLNADGSVKSTTREAREVMHLYGEQESRLIRKNGEALPPDKARAEQARFDKAVEKRSKAQASRTPEARAKRQEARRKQNAEDLLCQDEFLKMFEPHLAGSEAINGRAAWIVELKPLPNAAPRCNSLKVLTKFTAKIWIDQAEYRWARFEGENIAPVTWGKILVRVPTEGLHLAIEQTRHDDGAWLESDEHVKVNAKLLLAAAFRIDEHVTYSGYRKFQADSRVLDDAK